MVEALFLMQTTFCPIPSVVSLLQAAIFQPISHHFIAEETLFFLFPKTPFLISSKKYEKGDEMSCLYRRMTFPAYLAYCGMKKAACCDGHCSALQGQM